MLLESSDRRGERFQQVLKSDKRKFFIMCKLIKSHVAAKKAAATGNKHFTHMFDVLQKEKCTNLELLGINVIYEHPSKAKGGEKTEGRVAEHFDSYKEWAGEIQQRDNGSLIAHETGAATSYAMFSAQERGILFIKPQTEVYEGMVVGIHQRTGDLKVNVAKKKAATNVRSNKDATVVLNEPKNMSLDDCVEYIGPDELVEITPLNIRIMKNPKMGKRADRSKKGGA